MQTTIKRNLFIIKELILHFRLFTRISWNSLLKTQRIESLNTKFGFFVSSLLYRIYSRAYSKNNYLEIISSAEQDKIQTEIIEKSFLLQHNLLVLKKSTEGEKGVLLIKYSEIINMLPALFSIEELASRYHFVFIPSTESPFNPFNFIYRKIYKHTIVISHILSLREKKIFEDAGLSTIDLSAGDWINNNNFSSEQLPKKYDFCVVANFLPVKNYDFLIQSLKHWPKNTPLRLAVVASSYVGMGKNWFENLLKQNNLSGNCTIYTDIPSSEVSVVLRSSYCHVLCSWREGANKASFEAILSGIPAIVPRNHIGFPVHKFDSPYVLKYNGKKELINQIIKAKSIQITGIPPIGYQTATQKLNTRLKQLSTDKGFDWTENIVESSVTAHLHYINPSDATLFSDEYQFIESCKLKDSIPYSAERAKKMTTLKYD